MSILLRKSCARTASKKFPAQTAAALRLRARPIVRTISNRRCDSGWLATDFPKRGRQSCSREVRSAFSENAIALRNPLSEDHVALRPSLICGLAQRARSKHSRRGRTRSNFRNRSRFRSAKSGKEERRLGILLWGNATSAPHWRQREKHRLDFFELKGCNRIADDSNTVVPAQRTSRSRPGHRDFIWRSLDRFWRANFPRRERLQLTRRVQFFSPSYMSILCSGARNPRRHFARLKDFQRSHATSR